MCVLYNNKNENNKNENNKNENIKNIFLEQTQHDREKINHKYTNSQDENIFFQQPQIYMNHAIPPEVSAAMQIHTISNPNDPLIQYDYRNINDPLIAPRRRYDGSSYNHLTFKKVGMLIDKSAPINEKYKIMLLMGRQKYPRSEVYEYYAIDSEQNNIKFDIKNVNNKELQSGDNIKIDDINKTYDVTIDKILSYEYM